VRVFEAVKELFENVDRPTAIFLFNSLIMMGAVNAIQKLRLSIPGQTIFKSTITHIMHSIEELGRNTTRILLEKIMHPRDKKKHRVFLKPKLVVGD
jgi:DNA-binding LacI/PurR family transcriptional regulator